MQIELTWSEGTPKVADYYFVAREIGQGAGFFELAIWDGERWEHEHPEEIVSFIRFTEFTSQLPIKWPKPEPATGEYQKIPDDGVWEVPSFPAE